MILIEKCSEVAPLHLIVVILSRRFWLLTIHFSSLGIIHHHWPPLQLMTIRKSAKAQILLNMHLAAPTTKVVVQPRYQLTTVTIAIPLDCIVQILAAKATEERLQKVIVLMQNSCIQSFSQPAPCQDTKTLQRLIFFLLAGGSLTAKDAYLPFKNGQ